MKISEKNLRKSGSGDNLIANEFMKVREEKFGKSLSTTSTTTADVDNESSKKQGEFDMKSVLYEGYESKTQTSDSIENVIRTIPKQPAGPAS